MSLEENATAVCRGCNHRFSVPPEADSASCPMCAATITIGHGFKTIEVSGDDADEVQQVTEALIDKTPEDQGAANYVNKYLERAKSHPVLAAAIFFAIVVIGIAKFTEGIDKIIQFATGITSKEAPQSIPSKAESDLFDEWVILVGHAESQEQAIQLRDEFKSAYDRSGHVNSDGDPIWTNDILFARHPQEEGVWIVAIDAFPGESTREAVRNEQNELWEIANQDRDSRNTLGRFLYGSQVIYYSKSASQDTYGEILGQ